MQAVYQDDEHGCGVACVAMLLETNYSDAEKICGERFQAGWGIDDGPMIELLRERGIVCAPYKRLTFDHPVTALTTNALLSAQLLPSRGEIRRSEPTNVSYHWALWDAKAQAVRDPYRFRKPLMLTGYWTIEK